MLLRLMFFGKNYSADRRRTTVKAVRKIPSLVPIEMYREQHNYHSFQSHVTKDSNQALHRRRRRIFELQPIRGSGRNDSASPTAWRRCLPKPSERRCGIVCKRTRMSAGSGSGRPRRQLRWPGVPQDSTAHRHVWRRVPRCASTERSMRPPRLMSPRPTNSAGKRSSCGKAASSLISSLVNSRGGFGRVLCTGREWNEITARMPQDLFGREDVSDARQSLPRGLLFAPVGREAGRG